MNWDEIPCHVISVDGAKDVDSILLGEHLTTEPISNSEILELSNNLFSKYNDVLLTSKRTGISEKLFRKYVTYSRLPRLVQDYISMNSKNPKKDVKLGVQAADALNWSLGGDASAEKVLELMKLMMEKYDDGHWHGHLRDDSGIVGDGYSFGGCKFAVIVVGDDKGIFKNGKKMTRKEFEKLPDEFRNILRLQPTWE